MGNVLLLALLASFMDTEYRSVRETKCKPVPKEDKRPPDTLEKVPSVEDRPVIGE